MMTMMRERWLLVGILLLAWALRVVALDNAPPGLRYDEMQNHLMAGRVLAGERPLYFAESWGHEPLYHYAQAFFLGLFGQSDWSLRLTSPYMGILSVAAIWLVGRRLFDRRVALLAAAITAVAFWAIFYNRVGSRVGSTTFFVTLAIYFLWQNWTRPTTQRGQGYAEAVAGGIFAALGVYVYVAGRVALGFVPAFALYALLFHRPRLRAVWPRFAVYGVLSVLLVIPLFWTLQQFPVLEQRLDLINQPLNALKGGDPRPVLELTVKAWGMYVVEGERDWLFNVYGRPIFDWVTAVFFLLGLGVALWRWRQPAYALTLIWLLGGTAPAMLSTPAASLTHTIAAQPPAFLLLAGGIAVSYKLLAISRKPSSEGRTEHATRNTQHASRNTAFAFLAVGLILYYGLLSVYAYFGVWNRQPEVRELHQGGITAVADDLIAQPAPGPVAIGGPYINYWHPWNAVNFDLAMTADVSAVRWFNPAGGWVWPAAGPITYYFPTDPLGPQSYDPALLALFAADAQSLPTPADGDFTAYRMAEPAALTQELARLGGTTRLTWPPALAHLPAPQLPLLFGDRLALVAVDVAATAVAPGSPVRFVTYWEVRRADPAPLVAFAHVIGEGETIWGQQDWLDVRMAGLQPGDHFAQVHTVTINPETPPGEYGLLLGLYGPDTLLRLPIASGADDAAADRVVVGQVRVAGE
jgi:4-amino-4-deoxy-L-arabinose transferase-like glycosyltransferase